MKRFAAFSLVTLVVSLLAGCFETVYLSSAPDGTILVSAEGALVEVSADLSKARLVADGVARAEVSPDGERLLCVFYRDITVGTGGQHLDIAICDREAKVIKALGGADVSVGDYVPHGMIVPRWSPDGKFVSHLLPNPQNSDFTDLHVRDVEGTFDFVIPKVSSGYAWSPDSKEIAVISTASDDPDQMSLGSVSGWNVAGRSKEREPVGVLYNPYQSMAWPATDSLLFSTYSFDVPYLESGDEPPLQIFRLDIDRMEKLETVLEKPGLSSAIAGLFGLSPDGRRLAYVVWTDTDKAFKGELYLSAADGTGPKRLLDEREVHSAPRWLSNNRIAFVTEENTDSQPNAVRVYVIEPEGKSIDIWPLVEPVIKKAEADREARARQEEEQKQAAEPVKEFPSTSSTIQGTEATGK